jgi:predicted AAA+ superfamily ATPase
MLAHDQAALLNASRIAASLMIAAQTVTRYIDLLVDLLPVRRLRPFDSNVGKRLVKSPKVFVRDSGIVHGRRHSAAGPTHRLVAGGRLVPRGLLVHVIDDDHLRGRLLRLEFEAELQLQRGK